MSAGVVSIDGALYPAAEARVSVFDRGFLYGDSAFEVMRTYAGRPFRGPEHLARLARSCRRLLIELPLTEAELGALVARTIAGAQLPECYVRVMVTRGEGTMGLDLSLANAARVIVFALPLHTLPAAAYEQGVAVGLSRAARATDHTAAAGAKASNYLASLLALHEVKQRGCHEALIVGASGAVIEGATSNVFCVRAGELFTPPLDAGILAGITRQTVLELAARLGVPAHEAELMPDSLLHADEVFITSSVRELVPVVRVDDAVIGNGAPGPTSRRLLAAYRAETLSAT